MNIVRRLLAGTLVVSMLCAGMFDTGSLFQRLQAKAETWGESTALEEMIPVDSLSEEVQDMEDLELEEMEPCGDGNPMLMSNSDHVDDTKLMHACYDWLIANTDYKRSIIVGIMANIHNESNFDPTCEYQGYYGLIQWGGSRLTRLKTYCEEIGMDYRTTAGQLTYMVHEIEDLGEGNVNSKNFKFFSTLKSVDNSELGSVYVAYLWAKYYERCAISTYKARQDLAYLYWDYFTSSDYVVQPNLVKKDFSLPKVAGTEDTIRFTGKISADYTIQSIKAGLAVYEKYETTGEKEDVKSGAWLDDPAVITVKPDAQSYNLSQLTERLRLASLTAGKTYYLYVVAFVKGTGYTVYLDTLDMKSGSVLEPDDMLGVKAPSSPKISATLKSDGIKISWEEVAGADSYVVYRKSGSGEYEVLKTTKSSTRYFTDKTVVAGTKYTYGVKAVSDEWQTKKRTLTLTYIPPIKGKAVNKQGGVKLTWDAVSNVTGYKIYRKLVGGKYKAIATIGADKISYTDATAANGKEYAYSVVGYYEGAKETYASVKSWATIGRVDSITPTITNKSDGLLVKWKAVSGADEYVLYRTAEGGTLTKLATIAPDQELSYLDEQVVRDNGALYYYAVKAVIGDYSGANVKTGYYRLTQVQMTGLVNKSTLSCQVDWFANNHASGYQVQIATNSKMTENKKTYTVKGKNTEEKLISKLTKGTKYYVRIRAYYEKTEKKYYSAWCKTGTVTIKK